MGLEWLMILLLVALMALAVYRATGPDFWRGDGTL